MEDTILKDADETLVNDITSYNQDPLGFVLYAFPWGYGELKDKSGPDEWQRECLQDIGKGILNVNQAIQYAVASGHGVGKAQPNSLIIDTPNGKKCWGDLKKGDYVFGQNGLPVKIKAIHPQGIKKIFKVLLDDKSNTLVCDEHLWNVRSRNYRRNLAYSEKWQTISTKEIIEIGVRRKNGKTNARQWELPSCKPIEYPEKWTPIDPYTLGAWLGDGCRNSPRITSNDEELRQKIISAGYSCGKGRVRWDRCMNFTVAPSIGPFLKYLNVYDCLSHQKFIPDIYKYNTSKVREEVLRGLLDTDGYANAFGSVSYCTVSPKLMDDVIWLVRSLGGKASPHIPSDKKGYKNKEGKFIQGRTAYICNIRMPNGFKYFYIKRKQERIRPTTESRYTSRWIDSIEEYGNEECQCITVEAKDGLYLTNDFIVTHNSALVSWIILWGLSTFEGTKIVVTANTEGQLKTKTWAELAKWFNLFIAKHWFKFTATSIYIDDKDPERQKTWRADMIAWSEHNTEAFAGLHNQGKRIIIVMDEASAVADKIWEVTEGALTDEGTEIIWIAFGNPTRNTGRFFDCFHKLRHRWITKQVDSRTVKMTNKKQIQEWVDDYGEDSDFVKVRVRGLFPNASDRQFISSEIVDKAKGKVAHPSQYNFAPVILGVDCAWSGSDESVIYMRQGIVCKQLAKYAKLEDDLLFAGYLAKFEDEYNADAVFIDLGYGTGVYSAGKQMGRKWQLVSFGSESRDPAFLNKRGEMWGAMKTWLKEGGCLPPDEVICQELTGPEYMVKLNGKIVLESKEDMKKRGLSSPNRADALCLTFAFPVTKKVQGLGQSKLSFVKSDYDPFK